MDLNGWEQLICPYFNDVCLRVLAGELRSHGFDVHRIDEVGEATFHRSGVYLQFRYELETSPNYSPGVEIGFSSRFYTGGPHYGLVPMWYVIQIR